MEYHDISAAVPHAFDWTAYPWLGEHADRLAQLAEEFRYWNERINLVSRKEVDFLELRHILPCAAILTCVDFSKLKTHLDIGTGGGLPGLVIAILFPHLECTLVDSTAKKLKAIDHMTGMLNLDNVRTIHTRIEEHKPRYDIVTGRAVTALPRFLGWARHTLETSPPPAGLYYWKGGAFEPEIEAWKLQPDETFALEPILKDPYFSDKYIARYDTRRILNNKSLKQSLQTP